MIFPIHNMYLKHKDNLAQELMVLLSISVAEKELCENKFIVPFFRFHIYVLTLTCVFLFLTYFTLFDSL